VTLGFISRDARVLILEIAYHAQATTAAAITATAALVRVPDFLLLAQVAALGSTSLAALLTALEHVYHARATLQAAPTVQTALEAIQALLCCALQIAVLARRCKDAVELLQEHAKHAHPSQHLQITAQQILVRISAGHYLQPLDSAITHGPTLIFAHMLCRPVRLTQQVSSKMVLAMERQGLASLVLFAPQISIKWGLAAEPRTISAC